MASLKERIQGNPAIHTVALLYQVVRPHKQLAYPVLRWEIVYQAVDTLSQAFYPTLIGALVSRNLISLAGVLLFFTVLKFILLRIEVKMDWALYAPLNLLEQQISTTCLTHFATLGEAFANSNDATKIYDRSVTTPSRVTNLLETLFWQVYHRTTLIAFNAVVISVINPFILPVLLTTCIGFAYSTHRMTKKQITPRKLRTEAEEDSKVVRAKMVYGYSTLLRHEAIESYLNHLRQVFQTQREYQRQELACWLTFKNSGLMRDVYIILGTTAVAVVTVTVFIAGRITIDNVLLTLGLAGNLFGVLWSLGDAFNEVSREAEYMERILRLLAQTPSMPTPQNVTTFPQGDLGFSGRIKISAQNLDMDHPEDRELKELLDTELCIHPKSRIGLVGETGAGKSTLVKALARIISIDPESTVTLNGVPLGQIDSHDMLQHMAVVSQEVWTANGTIAEALALENPHITEAMMWEALIKAHFAHEVRLWEDGLQTKIGEQGKKLSGGERQRLEIARTILRIMTHDIRLLIIDEGTASVDTVTEQIIQKGLEELMHGRTSLIIAHRLSSVRDCDQILVMDHGTIVEEGSHTQLLELNGKYANLYSSQFQRERN